MHSKIDSKNKPQPVKLFLGINFKLRETACKMWNFVRFLPLFTNLDVQMGEGILPGSVR